MVFFWAVHMSDSTVGSSTAVDKAKVPLGPNAKHRKLIQPFKLCAAHPASPVSLPCTPS